MAHVATCTSVYAGGGGNSWMHVGVVCGVFLDCFFFCLVCQLFEKKLKIHDTASRALLSIKTLALARGSLTTSQLAICYCILHFGYYFLD